VPINTAPAGASKDLSRKPASPRWRWRMVEAPGKVQQSRPLRPAQITGTSALRTPDALAARHLNMGWQTAVIDGSPTSAAMTLDRHSGQRWSRLAWIVDEVTHANHDNRRRRIANRPAAS
jgi:hypothetical protein